MACLIALFALLTPRLVLLVVIILTDFVGRAYEGWLWPLLGFFFMPLTTLAYAAAINWNNGSVSGFYFFMVLLAALGDLGSLGGGRAVRRRQKVIVVERHQ
ncbi:MAG: hypothetical protein A2289_06290 [Deltaproteobacteria bacterium RIFOXYA12_FULL_58_15]|nr:MAG: hypothetical protein A2289_06290 [Deltaproteobacteria bacterium RIFOXYA12_FULL_58_15]OGR09858.1 MAG: hypothetical protein A2341_14225 [Deltaproteobacteria bacterium RIFOXYB12_FULL_58_9]